MYTGKTKNYNKMGLKTENTVLVSVSSMYFNTSSLGSWLGKMSLNVTFCRHQVFLDLQIVARWHQLAACLLLVTWQDAFKFKHARKLQIITINCLLRWKMGKFANLIKRVKGQEMPQEKLVNLYISIMGQKANINTKLDKR